MITEGDQKVIRRCSEGDHIRRLESNRKVIRRCFRRVIT